MTPQPTYTTQKLTIPALGTASVSRAATFLICLSASHRFRLRFEHGHETDFEAGLKFRQEVDFTRVEIINPSDTDELIVELGFGRGDVDDARLVLSGVIGTTVSGGQVDATIVGSPDVKVASGELNTKSRSPDGLFGGPAFTIPNGTTERLGLADHRRHRLHIWVGDLPANTWVFIGSNGNPGVSNGFPLTSRERLVLETTSEIYCANNTGAPAAVYVLEERWTAF